MIRFIFNSFVLFICFMFAWAYLDLEKDKAEAKEFQAAARQLEPCEKSDLFSSFDDPEELWVSITEQYGTTLEYQNVDSKEIIVATCGHFQKEK